MKKTILYILLFFSLFYSCTKEAKIKLPPQEDKLVVTSFISPNDTVIVVTVRNSIPKFNWVGIWGPQYSNLTDATVYISDGTTQIKVPFDQSNGMYLTSTKNFPIVSGKTYYLDVSTPDGKKASGETSVPEGVLQLTKFEVEVANSNPDHIKFNTLISIADLPETTYITGAFDVVSSWDTTAAQPSNYMYTESNYFSASDEFQSYSEYLKSKQTELYDAGYYRYIAMGVTLLNSDKHFYLYHKTIRVAPGSGDNPFSDPVMVYTNINGGFGCFGSYTRNVYFKRVR